MNLVNLGSRGLLFTQNTGKENGQPEWGGVGFFLVWTEIHDRDEVSFFLTKGIGSDLVEIPWLMKNSQDPDMLHIPDPFEHSHQSRHHRASHPTRGRETIPRGLQLVAFFKHFQEKSQCAWRVSRVKYINKIIQYE